MRELLVIFSMMTLLSVSVAFAMVEMYRIETLSYDTRVIAFYDKYFEYMESQGETITQTNLCAEQIDQINKDIAM
jgi:hypothetical protein